jgi:hypothetical protein
VLGHVKFVLFNFWCAIGRHHAGKAEASCGSGGLFAQLLALAFFVTTGLTTFLPIDKKPIHVNTSQ